MGDRFGGRDTDGQVVSRRCRDKSRQGKARTLGAIEAGSKPDQADHDPSCAPEHQRPAPEAIDQQHADHQPHQLGEGHGCAEADGGGVRCGAGVGTGIGELENRR